METYVARQPIFDKKQEVYAYELLFRSGKSNAFPNIDGDEATSKLLTQSFFTMGMEQITEGKKAFINFTKELLIKRIPTMFPSDSIIVEVLEDVEPDEDVLEACEEMSQKGYGIALDDFFYEAQLEPLVALSNIIKIDFRATPKDEIEKYVEKLSTYPVKFLAEKIETYEEFKMAENMGFEYFQGYFFSKPQVLESKDIQPNKLSLLQIMAEANKRDFEFEKLEKFISQDVSISYKLLRYMNSAYFKRVQEVSSIKQAIVLLGESGIRRFMSLIIMAKLAGEKPEELVRTSIIRARLCELFGEGGNNAHADVSELFTLGLFSLIDAILDDKMDRLMKELPLSENINRPLVEGKGELMNYLDLARYYEMGNWNQVSKIAASLGLRDAEIPGFYVDAIGWADNLSSIH